MSKQIKPHSLPRVLRLGLVIAGVAMTLGACTHRAEDVTASIPEDYRLRHPIAIQEADQTTEVFVGVGRGGLTASQRADVVGLAQVWLREGTGAIVLEVPTGTPNARSAADSAREVRGTLAAAGIPPRGVIVRHYRPNDPRLFATIRLHYPRLTASVGPCGLWPDDLGPSIKNKGYIDNKTYWNYGCATQRNIAAMAENPTDLLQPRPETPAYTARRTAGFEKYRKGTTSATTYPEADKAKLSEVGK